MDEVTLSHEELVAFQERGIAFADEVVADVTWLITWNLNAGEQDHITFYGKVTFPYPLCVYVNVYV